MTKAQLRKLSTPELLAKLNWATRERYLALGRRNAATAAKLDTIASRIQEILAERADA